MTIHRTGKTTQQKKKKERKFENPREIFLELKGMHFISIKSHNVWKNPHFLKNPKSKEYKSIFCRT